MTTIAVIGSPNVGKSTLFNRLCQNRSALVHDRPRLTRDRQYGIARIGAREITLIDTGGIASDTKIDENVSEQTAHAITEADFCLCVVDGSTGYNPSDEQLAADLRRANNRVLLVINKIDRLSPTAIPGLQEYHRLGLGEPLLISATKETGFEALKQKIVESLPIDQSTVQSADKGICVAIIGRANVGKSSLVNCIVGSERCVVFDEIGTTRDAIDVPFQRDDKRYTLIDTAGIRRKGKVSDTVEKFSVVKALAAIRRSHIAVLLTDATESIVDQDLHVLEYANSAGAGLVLAINKWDLISPDEREWLRSRIERKLRFAPWIPTIYISALRGANIDLLFREINLVYQSGNSKVKTGELNRELQSALRSHPVPLVRRRPIKLRYINMTGSYPPRLLIHGNRADLLPSHYIRYLENHFRNVLKLRGFSVQIEFASAENPFKANRTRPRRTGKPNRRI